MTQAHQSYGLVGLRVDPIDLYPEALFCLRRGCCYFGVTRNTPPVLESSSIHSAPSGATSTSRIR